MAWSRKKLLRKIEKGTREFPGKNLEGIDLSGLELRGIKFVGCNLKGANLSGATVSGGRFDQADLSGADLSGARFGDVVFKGSNLGGVNWKEAAFSNCWGLGGLPLEVIGDSFSNCEFPERLAYVLEFQEAWGGELDSNGRAEAIPIWVTLEREGREARVGVPCGGMPCEVIVPIASNAAGPFQIWWIEKYLPPEDITTGCMRVTFEEKGRELAEKLWIVALPEELDGLQARIDGLAKTRDALFEALADPMINEVKVTGTEVRFVLGPFFYPGIRVAMERALAVAVQLASRLDVP